MKRTSPTLSVRCSDALYKAFRTKATRFGGQSEVLRELIAAFVEDRLTIQPPKTLKESLYVTRK